MITDVSCSTGSWPFRDYRGKNVADLDEILASEGIDRAFTSSIDAVIAADPDESNRQLFADAKGFARIEAVPVINPRLRLWRRVLDSYRSDRRVRAIKLHPNYHDYALAGPRSEGHADELADYLVEAKIPLIVTVRILDDRYHPPAMGVPHVPIDEIRLFAESHPALPIICLNCYLGDVKALGSVPNLSCDIASVEYFRSIETALKSIPAKRLLFGSHTPFYVTRAALMKLVWSDAPDSELEAIASGNAEALFR